MPESKQALLISALPPSRTQERTALVVGLLLLALFLAVLPFAHVRLGQLNIFLPMVATVMFLNDTITATLLYAQFSISRTPALLVLASGYLFTALVVVAYALTFPGAFTSATGLLGAGLQTSPWLFTIWHVGLPATIIGYAVMGSLSAGPQLAPSSIRAAILASVFFIIALVCVVVWFVIVHEDILPDILATDIDGAAAVKVVSAVMLTLCATAFVMLLFSRRSVLDLWLLLASLAWLLSSILVNLVGVRFDVAWYANRMFAVISASFVLLVLLAESTMLYARLALSVQAQRREREGGLMTLDAILAAIEHETRQPLAAISLNASAGLVSLDNAPFDFNEARDIFTEIDQDAHRANEVIRSIRAISPSVEKATAALDPNELIRETIVLARSDLEKEGVSVQLGLAPQLVPVRGHHGQLQQVILNLVNNAVDAMRLVNDRERILTVKSESLAPDGIAITVEDSGTGIDPKNVDQMFDAFFTTKSKGMGMGLAICRSIIDRHGGTLSVSPGAPYGSVFRVVLPGSG